MIRFECLAASLQSKINYNMLEDWPRGIEREREGGGGRQTERQRDDSLINKLITQQEIRLHFGPPPRQKMQSTRGIRKESEREKKMLEHSWPEKPHESVFGQPTKPKRSEANLSNLYGNVSIINGVDCFAANVWRIWIEIQDIWRIYIHIQKAPSILCVIERHRHTMRLKLRNHFLSPNGKRAESSDKCSALAYIWYLCYSGYITYDVQLKEESLSSFLPFLLPFFV